MKEISKTFCILPWIHLSTRPSGKMRVCCTANASAAKAKNDRDHKILVTHMKGDDGLPASLAKNDLLTSWNNSYMRNIRLMMLEGEIPPCCQKCFNEEKVGHKSKRLWETDYWSKQLDVTELVSDTKKDGSVPPQIRYIDLRLGAKCNLKCIMCSPHDSTLWYKDWLNIFPKIKNKSLKENFSFNYTEKKLKEFSWYENNPKFWKQLYKQLPHLRQLYFAGGEITIVKEHYDLIDEIIKRDHAKNIELRYNSNGIKITDELISKWEKFRNVKFHFSIDSVKEMNQYIRYPLSWKKVIKQLKRLDKTTDTIEVSIACAVQVMNIYYIPDLIKWKLKSGFKKVNKWPNGAGMVNFHFVYLPQHFNVRVLPIDFKKKTIKKYEEFYVWLRDNYKLTGAPSLKAFEDQPNGIKRLEGLLAFMDSEDWSIRLPELAEFLKLNDETRSLSCKETFPEMNFLS